MINVENLTKQYGDFKAVDNISFEVKKGEVFAFLGPNGAGKTTTIKMLTTLLQPTSGSIKIAGNNPVTNPSAVRKSFGIVFQDPSLDDELTALENMDFHAILYGVEKGLRKKRVEQMLKFVELWDRRNELVKHFSGGMKRRLEIARGLVHHPQILFLDEPTLGLDPQTRNHIWSYVQDMSRDEGMTIFFTTHYMDEADKNASRIAIIDGGKIIAAGTSAELKEKTKTTSLEEAFLALTGKEIRDTEAGPEEHMRMRHSMWTRR